MARVNVEERAFADGRVGRLAKKMGWWESTAIGQLVFLWRDSQEAEAARGTAEQIVFWSRLDFLEPEEQAKWVRALGTFGYIRETDTPGQWEIAGNADQIAGIQKARGKAKKGGEATKSKWLELRDAEGYKPATSRPGARLGVGSSQAQYNTKQYNSEREGESDSAREAPSAVADPPKPKVDLVAIWNANRGGLPEARPTKGRLAKIAARLREEAAPAYWEGVVQRLARSAFATGNNDRAWRADFGWLVQNPENHVKVSEGKYDNRDRAAASDPFAFLQNIPDEGNAR